VWTVPRSAGRNAEKAPRTVISVDIWPP
jgi:hypothetical protein